MSSFQKPKGPRVICVLLYGDPKTGKSRAALSFPKPAVIDYEGGATDWFADTVDFVSAQAQTFAQGEKLLGELRSLDVKTIIEDSVSAPHYRLMESHQGDDGKVNPQGWPLIKLTERAHVQRVRDLGLNYVATAWEKAEYYRAGDVMKNGRTATGKEFARKSWSPDYDEDLVHVFDLAIRTFHENGRYYGEITHSRSDRLPAGKVIENVTYRNLIELVKAAKAVDENGDSDLDRAIEKAIAEVGLSRGDVLALTLKTTHGQTNDYRELDDASKRAVFAAIAHFRAKPKEVSA